MNTMKSPKVQHQNHMFNDADDDDSGTAAIPSIKSVLMC